MATICVLHPGSMGASVGGALAAIGHDVRWVRAGRSPATVARAEEAGLRAVADLATAVGDADAVLSICPPAAAEDVANAVATAGFAGCYVDANAIAPAAASRVGAAVEAGGARWADGGIIGGPARAGASGPRLALSGAAATEAAGLFAGGDRVVVTVLDQGGPTAASALKMTYAAWTKGTNALLIALRSLARSLDVEAPLLDAWASQPGLADRSLRAARGSAPKAWRWVDEMEQIAATFEAAGLPGGFHHGAAEVFRRLEECKDASPEPDDVFDQLRRGG